MCKVSIIIPAYNCSTYIPEALDSALTQDYKDFEIIVVDDGSTDNTQEVLKKYGKDITYVYQEKHGVSNARNRGILEARGEYIALLDADDVWLPNKLNIQVEIMEANPDVAIIFTDGVIFDENGIFVNSLKPTAWSSGSEDSEGFGSKIVQAKIDDGSILKGNYYKDLLINNLVGLTSSVVIRKKCFEKVGYFAENLHSSEDYNLWLRMAYEYPLVYLNKLTLKYRERNDSLCGEKNMRGYYHKKWNGIMFEHYSECCPSGYRNLFIKKACESYRVAIWGYFQYGDTKNVRSLCYRFLRHNTKSFKIYFYILLSFLPAKIINRITEKTRSPLY